MKLKLVLLLALLACFALPYAAQAGPEGGQTDPLDKSAGDFLDGDWAGYVREAGRCYSEGDYLEAARYYLLAARADPTDSGSIYKIACCYGLLGKAELAAAYLERSYKAGFTDVEHMHRDTDFNRVSDSEVFKAALERIDAEALKQKQEQGELITIAADTLLKCRVMLPEDYQPGKSYTLIVGMHGYGDNLDDFSKLFKARGMDIDFIYAAPQAPYAFNVGGRPGYSWTLREGDAANGLASVTMSREYIAKLVEHLERRYRIDKTWLFGFSQGGAMTWLVGLPHYEMFDGLICFAGRLDPTLIDDETLAAASGTPVLIVHGTLDNAVNYSFGVEARDLLKKSGYDVTFFEFTGAHTVPKEGLQKMLDWISKR